MDDYRRIGIMGKVTVKNGDKVIIVEEPNAIVRQGLRHVASTLMSSGVYLNAKDVRMIYFGSYAANILFGKNVAATVFTTDALVTQIASNPSSGVQNSTEQAGTGNYRYTKYTANWNSGVLNGFLTGAEKLSEIGLFLNLFDNLTAGWSLNLSSPASHYTYTNVLFSRISLGENAFVPDLYTPVLVEWEIGVDFV